MKAISRSTIILFLAALLIFGLVLFFVMSPPEVATISPTVVASTQTVLSPSSTPSEAATISPTVVASTQTVQTALSPSSTPSVQITPVSTPSSAWTELLARLPFAYTSALPPAVQSPVDGTYAKVDPNWPQWWLCRRCADYRVVGGIWKLQFDQGVMRIYYDVTGWYSLTSFTISDDRLTIFNDPYCPEEVGEYRWQLVDGQLELALIADACSFGLRGENLSKQPWPICR